MVKPGRILPNIQVPEGHKNTTGTRKKTRFEIQKIFELKAKIDGIKKQKHKLFAIFDDSRDVEKGYSIRELASVLVPKHTQENGEPTCYGQGRAKEIIRRWRQEILKSNKEGSAEAVVVPFAIKDRTLGWIYYNMQSKRDFAGVIKLGEDVINGVENLLKEFLTLLEMNRTERNDVNNEMRENIRRALLTLQKSKRRKQQ